MMETMKILKRNLYIIEDLGLGVGYKVVCDDQREFGDVIVPEETVGTLTEIRDDGSVTVDWHGYGIETDIDPHGLETTDDDYPAWEYEIMDDDAHELDRLRVENARLREALGKLKAHSEIWMLWETYQQNKEPGETVLFSSWLMNNMDDAEIACNYFDGSEAYRAADAVKGEG
jgi:hypothetical protein